jgi:phosphorylated CTD-interacting factor 1
MIMAYVCRQAAVAPTVVSTLHRLFGVTVECFASPLNAYLPAHCSLFPDTDAAFGSMGSFFELKPGTLEEGSFEANPPFIPQLMG